MYNNRRWQVEKANASKGAALQGKAIQVSDQWRLLWGIRLAIVLHSTLTLTLLNIDAIFNGPIFQLLVHLLSKRANQQSWLFGLFSHPFKDCCLASSGYFCTLLTFKSVTRILFVRVFYPPLLQTCVAAGQASLQLRAQSLGSDLMLPRKPKRGRPRIQIIGLDSDGMGGCSWQKKPHIHAKQNCLFVCDSDRSSLSSWRTELIKCKQYIYVAYHWILELWVGQEGCSMQFFLKAGGARISNMIFWPLNLLYFLPP